MILCDKKCSDVLGPAFISYYRRAINIDQMPHHFAINCNKYYINKSHSVQIAPTRGQNANQNPQGGDAIDNQIPHICPTPLSGG